MQDGSMAGESPVTGTDPLDGFSPATRAWFDGAFAEPTQAQAGAWRAIGKGEDTLVVAPTGSGKTLAAFLWALGVVSVYGPASRAALVARDGVYLVDDHRLHPAQCLPRLRGEQQEQ